MEWEIAPSSKNKNFKINVTEKLNGEVFLHMILFNGESFFCGLNDIEDSNNDELIDYINNQLPKILSGVYDKDLLKNV